MTETLKAEYELTQHLEQIANKKLATWNKERSSETLNAFVMMKLEREALINVHLK